MEELVKVLYLNCPLHVVMAVCVGTMADLLTSVLPTDIRSALSYRLQSHVYDTSMYCCFW